MSQPVELILLCICVLCSKRAVRGCRSCILVSRDVSGHRGGDEKEGGIFVRKKIKQNKIVFRILHRPPHTGTFSAW